MEQSGEQYTRTTLHGVPVIVWNHFPYQGKEYNLMKKQRKKLKDVVGADNKDVPMLDTRQADSDLEFCDIIICTDNIPSWKLAIQEFYSDYSVNEKIIDRGHQIELCHTGEKKTFVTINFYPGTGKFMVQPGDCLEANLLSFLASTPAIAQMRTSVKELDGSFNCEQNEKEDLDPVETRPSRESSFHDVETSVKTVYGDSDSESDSEMNSVDSGNDTENDASHVEVSQDYNIVHSDSDDSSLLDQTVINNISQNEGDESGATGVKSPSVMFDDQATSTDDENVNNILQKECDESDETVVKSPLVTSDDQATSTDDENRLIVNELLCFVQNKINTVPYDLLAKVCAEFYDHEDIYQSKQLMHKLSDENTRPRFIKHKGEDKSYKDMKDIQYLMLQMNVPYTHQFVVKDLANLPPLSLLNSDNSKILQEIDKLKTEVKAVVLNQKDFAEQMLQLKQQKTVHTSIQGTQTVSPDDIFAQTQDKSRHVHQSILNSQETHPKTVIDVDDEPDDSSDQDGKSDSNLDRSPYPPVYRTPVPVSNRFAELSTPLHPTKFSRTFTRSRVNYTLGKSYATATKNGSQQSQATRGIVGNGANTTIHAATVTKTPPRNRRCTGLFVTRLKPNTPAENLQRHVLKETGLKLLVVKLKTRYDTYSSFHVKCDKQVLSKLLNSYMWPKGTFIKPFFE